MSALLFALASQASAQTQIGYTTGNMGRTTVFHYGASQKQGMAIRLSHEKLQVLKGQSIQSIRTAFGSANGITDKQADFFIATSLDGAPVYEQTLNIGSANRWTDYTLNTPYTITGDEQELLVGYTLVANSSNIPEALQADKKNRLQGCSYAWDGGHWVDLYNTSFGSANIYLTLSGSLSFSDAILAGLDLSENYYLAGQNYGNKTHIFNFGTETITGFEVTIKNGSEESTVSYNNLNIPQYGMHEFSLPDLYSAATGQTDIEVNVTVNSANEGDVSDNTFQSSAFFYPEVMERSIFVEEFTGTACSNCPAGARTLQTAIEQSGQPCVEIMHHAGYSADIYSTDADWDYTIYYGSPNTFAPAAMVNRLHNPDLSDVPVMNISLNDMRSAIDYAATRQPYVSLSLSSAFDETTRQADISLRILGHNDLPGATLLNVFLVQDSLVSFQSNGGVNYVHNGVTRKVLTGNSWGMLLPDVFNAGQQQDWSTSYVLPDAIFSDFYNASLLQQTGYSEAQVTIPTDAEHMRIVAYVASYDPSNINNNTVYNCIEVPLVNGSYTQAGWAVADALEQIGSDASAPASDNTFDLQGRRLSNGEKLPAGFYIIRGQKVIIR